MDPTVAQVLSAARSHLDDILVVSGEVFTDAVLTPFLQTAYNELISKLSKISAGEITKTAYYTLPSRTTYLTPELMGLTDFDEPISVAERGGLRTAVVTGASAAAPIVVTAADHPFSDLEEVIVSKVGPEANGRWFINYINSSSFSLRGSTSATTYSAITASATASTEKFVELRAVDNLSQLSLGESLGEYEWEDGALRFPGATEDRQLKIEYRPSGVVPAAGKVGIPNSFNFLSARTAALAAAPHGNPLMVSHLNELCFGIPSRGISGFLDDVIRPAVLSMQRHVWRPAPFRRRRTRNRNL